MLYTLTLNPAIDLFIDLNELLPKKVKEVTMMIIKKMEKE